MSGSSRTLPHASTFATSEVNKIYTQAITHSRLIQGLPFLEGGRSYWREIFLSFLKSVSPNHTPLARQPMLAKFREFEKLRIESSKRGFIVLCSTTIYLGQSRQI